MNLSKSFIKSVVHDLATKTGNTPGNQVLGIGGSPRKNGNSDVLLNQILESVKKQGIGTSAAHLRDITFLKNAQVIMTFMIYVLAGSSSCFHHL